MSHISIESLYASGKHVSLVYFTKREEIKLIEPNRAEPGTAINLGDGIVGISDRPS